MKVSIVIPVYSVEEYIEECLTSAFNQTYADIEFIIVDDASPDSSMVIANRLIEKYKEEKSIIVVKHEFNKGLSAARNTGIIASSGEYLYFMDSDDILPDRSIELLVDSLSESPVDIVVGGYSTFVAKNDKDRKVTFKAKGIYHGGDVLDSFLAGTWPEMAWNKLVRRTLCVENELFFPEGIVHEDNYWSFLVASTANSLCLCEHVTYLYRLRSQSITQNKSRKNFDSLLFVIDKIVDYSLKADLFYKHPLLMNYIINLSYYLYKELIRSNADDDYVEKIRLAIKIIVNEIPIEHKTNIDLTSKTKFVVYSMPGIVSKIYLQFVLFLQKMICKQ